MTKKTRKTPRYIVVQDAEVVVITKRKKCSHAPCKKGVCNGACALRKPHLHESTSVPDFT